MVDDGLCDVMVTLGDLGVVMVTVDGDTVVAPVMRTD